MKSKRIILFTFIAFSIFGNLFAQKPGWAVTPPMGWNSWNHFGQNINEKLIMEIADGMVSSGMKDAGYEYVVIDDGWELGLAKSLINDKETSGRAANGTILVDTVKFPHGIKYLADYVHSKGLKFGIYTSPGPATCGGHTGSEGYEEKDVNTFAEWGADFIKLDWCSCTKDGKEVLTKWREALNKASRPIVLSANTLKLFDWLPEYGDMWRTSGDIQATWISDPFKFKIFPGISDVIFMNAYSPIRQKPSAWNDPDMLQVCNWDLPLEESKSHFSLWAMFGAPLIAGNDLRNMSPEAIKILTNREVIEVDQDPLGHQGVMIKGQKYGTQLWAKKLLQYSDYAVLLLNNNADSATVTFSAADLGLNGPVFLRDLWKHKDIGMYSAAYSVKIPAHGVAMLKLTANEYPVKLPEFKVPELPVGTVIEAEDAYEFQAGYQANQVKGFTGSGYVMGQNHDWAGLYVAWRYLIPAKVSYKITIRYFNPTKESLLYACNGQKIVLMPCKKDKWNTVSAIINLEKGLQSISISSELCQKNTVAIDNVLFEIFLN